MTNPIVAAIANFFLQGLGYILAGVKRGLGRCGSSASSGSPTWNSEYAIRSRTSTRSCSQAS